MNKACTSQIIATKGTHKVVATYFKNHNRALSVAHLRISKNDRIVIAGKMRAGISVAKILEQNTGDISGTDLKRNQLLQRKDVHNIKEAYGINSLNEGKRHKDDAVSIDL